MGVLWRGEHRAQQLPVAIKVLTGRAGETGTFHSAVRSEVEAVARLSHRHIIQVFDYGRIRPEEQQQSAGQLPEGQPYIAMELASHGSLDRRPPTSWPELHTTLQELLGALSHAHARGVIHRDLKPSNVLLCSEDDLRPGLKLSDFGIATVPRQSHVGHISGTPPYMSPEQFRGDPRDVGPWTDLYALGCMAWEWTTGSPPFGFGRPMRLAHHHLYDEPPPLRPRYPVPAQFEAWMRRLLEKSPELRFRLSADALANLPPLVRPHRQMLQPLGHAPAPTRAPQTTLNTLDALLIEDSLDPQRTLDDIVMRDKSRRTDEFKRVAPIEIKAPAMTRRWMRPPEPETQLRVLQATLNLYGLRAVPLVGRESERHQLWQALQEVHLHRQPRAVVLQGQAGVGKSALARWMMERTQELGVAHGLVAHHDRHEGPGLGLTSALQSHLRISGLGPARALDRVSRYLRARGLRQADEILAIADGLNTSESGVPHRSTSRERYALFARLLGIIGSDRPTLLWLDDAHWSLESLDFVTWLLESEYSPDVLVLMTVQNEALAESPRAIEALASIQDHPHTRTTRLTPLPETEARDLVQRLLRLDTDLSDTVVRRTGGNPLFTVHLLGDWVQRGLLQPTAEGLTLQANAEAPLPDDLYDVWSARLERVIADRPHTAHLALELAATLGVSIDQEEWHICCAMAGMDPPDGLVGLLVRSRLAIPTANGWRFAHGMLQEAVERVAREVGRWPAHNLIAARMVKSRRGTSGRVGRTGRYLLEANLPDQSLKWLLEAARRRMAKDEARHAADLLKLAREALEQAEPPSHDGRWGVWRLLRVRILKARQQLDEAWTGARAVESAAQQHGWSRLEAEALADQADIARIRGDLPTALGLSQRALTRYRDLDDTQGVADTLRSLSSISVQLGSPEVAEDLLVRARDRYTELGDRFGTAMCLAGLGDIARVRLQWEEATGWFEAALTLLRTLRHRSGVALSLHGLAEVQRLTGNLDAARDGYLQVIQLDVSLGRDNTISRLNLSLCEIARGSFQQAQTTLRDLERIWSARGRPGYLAIVHVANLPCSAAHGHWDDFTEHLARAAELLDACSLVDLDVAHLAEHAASIAEKAAQPEHARAALELAMSQWRALGADDKVALIERQLDGHTP